MAQIYVSRAPSVCAFLYNIPPPPTRKGAIFVSQRGISPWRAMLLFWSHLLVDAGCSCRVIGRVCLWPLRGVPCFLRRPSTTPSAEVVQRVGREFPAGTRGPVVGEKKKKSCFCTFCSVTHDLLSWYLTCETVSRFGITGSSDPFDFCSPMISIFLCWLACTLFMGLR